MTTVCPVTSSSESYFFFFCLLTAVFPENGFFYVKNYRMYLSTHRKCRQMTIILLLVHVMNGVSENVLISKSVA